MFNGLFTVSAVRAWKERVVARINRLRSASTTMRSDYISGQPESAPHHLTEEQAIDSLREAMAALHKGAPKGKVEVLPGSCSGKVPPKYIEPPISDTKAGVHFPYAMQGDLEFLAREYGRLEKHVKILERNQRLAAKNMDSVISLLERMVLDK